MIKLTLKPEITAQMVLDLVIKSLKDLSIESKFILTTDALPEPGQRVLSAYPGVYWDRVCTFWLDDGKNPHFGLPSELDGRGSQPATHWYPIPSLDRSLL